MNDFRKVLVLLSIVLLMSTLSSAQDENKAKKRYTTTAGEIIFSWANIEKGGGDLASVTRFSPVFNFQTWYNMDQSKHFGFITGAAIRNTGFIYDKDADTRMKHRNYSIGIPVGVKVGNLKRTFVYGGYEIEFPFHYKEKEFINDKKSKFTVWFSNRTPRVYHTVFWGVQFPYGANLKFKYYLTEFFNTSYKEIQSGQEVYPYQDLHVNVFYMALTFNLFTDTSFYYKSKDSNYKTASLFKRARRNGLIAIK